MFKNLAGQVPPRRAYSTVVQRFRRQQLIKESNEECQKIITQGQFLLYYRGKPLLHQGTPRLASFAQAVKWMPGLNQEAVFLKLQDDDVPIFAAMLPKETDVEFVEKSLQAKFVDIRVAMFMIRSQWSGLMSGGSSLLRWVKSAQFCWSCRAPLERNASGCQLKCTNSGCGAIFHPPTSPVGISLIAAQDHSKALLIRQPVYPPGMYSCVAGFVDPGESLAECVIREGAEEAGVDISAQSLQLVDSNHWPNPSGSLMMGCIVTTDTLEPTPCSREIEDVRWFQPQELYEAVKLSQANPRLRFEAKDPQKLFVPPQGAIANVIIRHWLKHFHGLT